MKQRVTIEIEYDETEHEAPQFWNFTDLLDAHAVVITATAVETGDN